MEINLARIFGDTTSPNLMTCYTFFFSGNSAKTLVAF